MARPAIFRDKSAENDVHGRLTNEGLRCFEVARKTLAAIVDWPVDRVSDGDVVEFLARGERATRKYLKAGLTS